MLLTSTVSMKCCPPCVNSPRPVGASFARSSRSQTGWVKSPVPTRVIPLRPHHFARCSTSISRLVARLNFECRCRSAMIRIAPDSWRPAGSPSRAPCFARPHPWTPAPRCRRRPGSTPSPSPGAQRSGAYHVVGARPKGPLSEDARSGRRTPAPLYLGEHPVEEGLGEEREQRRAAQRRGGEPAQQREEHPRLELRIAGGLHAGPDARALRDHSQRHIELVVG